MVASTGLAILLRSSSCTIQTPLISRVKIEPGVESITILNDNSDVSLPQVAMPPETCSSSLPPLHAPNESFTCTSRTLRVVDA
jgi:hypothetical protein